MPVLKILGGLLGGGLSLLLNGLCGMMGSV